MKMDKIYPIIINSNVFKDSIYKKKAKKPRSAQKPTGLKKVRETYPWIIFFNLEKRSFEKKVIAQLN